MAELIVETGPRAGVRIPLTREAPCTIGSARESTLRLESTGVAREHCVVKALKDGGFGLKALGGDVLVDGQPISACRLDDTAKIQIADTRIRFALAASPAGEEATAKAASDPAPEPTPKGTTLGGYRLIEVLGKGGWGTVYRAEQVSLHRELALKVLNKELTKDPVFVARFVAEARAAARLSHPNVVQVFDVGHVDDTYFYSMEIMQAGSLERRLKQNGKLPVDEALTMLGDAARGLAFAESMRIVHRDIKPDNLMIDQHGTVKIVDLGLAMSDEDEQTKIAGTPHFMSPEQAQRKPVDHRSDLYSLGCTFYRLMTGKTPFSGTSSKEILKAQVTQAHEPASKVEPTIPGEVSAILDKLLEKDPAARFQSANELLTTIDAVLTPPTRKGLLLAGIAVAVLVAGGAVWYAVTHKGETTVVEKTVTETDPEGQKAKREVAATDARDVLDARHLQGLALAEALDALAKEHPETKAAQKAIEEGKRIRAEVADSAQKAAARAQRLQEAIASLTKAAQEARTAADFSAAARVLELGGVAEDLRSDPAVTEFVATEKKAIATAAAARLAALVAAVEGARTQKDPRSLRASLADLEAAIDDKSGWPASVLADRAAPRTLVGTARGELQVLEKSLASAAEQAAWKLYADGITAASTVACNFEFDAARKMLTELATKLADKPQAARIGHFVAAIDAAQRFHQRWLAEVQQGKVTLSVSLPTEGVDGLVVVNGMVPSGDKAGVAATFGTKPKAKQILVPIDTIKDLRWLELFNLQGDQGSPHDRAALVGLFALSAHVAEAHRYLARLKPSDDASGTGTEGYQHGHVLPSEVARLLASEPKEAWADSLAAELEATTALAQGLRALSERRNLTAASWLERLQVRLADSVVARSLQ